MNNDETSLFIQNAGTTTQPEYSNNGGRKHKE